MLKSSAVIGILTGALFLLSACGPPAKSVEPVAADPALTRQAALLQSPPSDRARVIIISGETMRNITTMYYSSNYIVPHDQNANIYVNGSKIGVLNAREAMVFDVAPGAYSFSWIPFKEGPEYLRRAEPSTHNLNGGGLLILSTWYDSGLIVDKRYTMQRASREARAADGSAAGLAIRPGIMIVRPSSCPATICR